VSRVKWNFIYSSPSNSVKFMKASRQLRDHTYIMPTWSEQDFNLVEADVSQWYENFRGKRQNPAKCYNRFQTIHFPLQNVGIPFLPSTF
jgi:hypothetical protein